MIENTVLRYDIKNAKIVFVKRPYISKEGQHRVYEGLELCLELKGKVLYFPLNMNSDSRNVVLQLLDLDLNLIKDK